MVDVRPAAGHAAVVENDDLRARLRQVGREHFLAGGADLVA